MRVVISIIASVYALLQLHADVCLCSGFPPPPPTICSEQVSPCECTFSNGSKIDLTSIASKDSNEPKFFRVPGSDQFYYYYNPCYTFSIGEACAGIAACQEWYSQFVPIAFGAIQHVSFGQDARGTFIYYEGPTDNFAINGRVTMVYLQCNVNPAAAPLLAVQGDFNEEHRYVMTLTHYSACLQDHGSGGGSSGLSIGTYMCIGFAVIVIVYFVAGVAFMHFRRGAQGVEKIPNYAIWSELPGLMKDGIDFLREKVTGTSSKSEVKYDQM